MAARPSIKATGFQSAADDLERLTKSGRISMSELQARLPAGDFDYLNKTLAASSWVPVETYVRVSQILAELEGGEDHPSYFRMRGKRAAKRLHDVGVYKQFDTSVETWGKRAGTMATTLTAVLYNFTKWTFEAKEGRHPFQITVREAEEFPDSLRFVGEGFIEYISSHFSAGRDVFVSSERVSPDRIVYSIEVE